jgi:hypothetical protein
MTARCDRFEREGLLELERGRPLDPHFAACPDCRAMAERYEALTGGLRSLGQGEEPPAGWRNRVLEMKASAAGRRWQRWAWAPAGLAAAAALAVLLLPRPAARPIGLEVDVASGSAPARRTAMVVAGDRISLRIRVNRGSHAELRLYRNDTDLLLRCSGQPPCRRDATGLSAEVTLDTMGRYQPVAVVSAQPLPPAGKGLDSDSAAAFESGAAVYFGREVTVE